MEKKIKDYRKKVESKNDKEDAKQPSTKMSGSCSGERGNNRKRGRESLGLEVDANKRQKVTDKQVNMEGRSSVGKDNAEPGTDMAREDSSGRKVAGPRVSPANESESRSSRKLDEQSVEGLLLVVHDTEERQEVHKMLKNATGSGSNISEFVFISSSTRLTCLLLDLQGSKYSTTGTRCITSSCHEHRGDDRKRPSAAFRRQF
jgi:hypothetical protein